ncbi:GyrI-like domain-containing protein [Galbibacter sp. BG1]|uniref:GyrI-like domain-containing protein n=1 Tax=Galbibacter sp. BG1 TaxID=1170699 RepID=UPI0015B9BE6D|nr:GyrI-like domain-containing protein [Galbibacter sp. BG1]QLE00115.1 GyrI-like domain-containing protein [Galbibacter sp. BG1]
MHYRIEEAPASILLGLSTEMSLVDNKTKFLWSSFMPKLGEITNRKDEFFYSVEEYPDDYFKTFNPTKIFKKWAAIAVYEMSDKKDLEILKIPKGKYAVFNYVGKSSKVYTAYQYIYGEWLAKTNYKLDDRPHFALMGAKYKNGDPASEEELWIPIK